MTQLNVRTVIMSRARDALDKIEAAATQEEKMRVALENIRDLHDSAQGFFYMKESWDKVAEAVEWVDVYEDLVDVTKQLATKGLEA